MKLKHLPLLVAVIIVIVLSSQSAVAVTTDTQLTPLVESSGAINWKDPNPSEVAYVGTRSGALFLMMAKAARTGTDEEKKIADALERKARIFLAVGKLFELSTKTGTEDGFNKRLLLIADRYGAIMRESKELNNTFFPPFVRSDAEAANKVFPFYEVLASEVSGGK
jgi:hypothetical protein